MNFLIKKKKIKACKRAWHKEPPNKDVIMSESNVRISILCNRDLSAPEAWVWQEEIR